MCYWEKIEIYDENLNGKKYGKKFEVESYMKSFLSIWVSIYVAHTISVAIRQHKKRAITDNLSQEY